MVEYFTIKEQQALTPKQIVEIKQAIKIGVHTDRESPELSQAMINTIWYSIPKQHRKQRPW